MSTIELTNLESQLTRGDRKILASKLGVGPSKITLAFDGFVKSPDFMAKLKREAIRLIGARQAVA